MTKTELRSATSASTLVREIRDGHSSSQTVPGFHRGIFVELIASSAATLAAGDPRTLGAAAVTNAGSIRLQGTSGVSGATLLLAGNVKLSGGGTLSLSPSGNNVITDSGGTSTLTNLNNTISGAGTLGDLTLTLINSGTIVGNASGLFLSNILSAVNAGTLEATTASGLVIHAEFVNSKTIEALGSGASVVLDNAVVSNTSTGVILASGSGARILLGQWFGYFRRYGENRWRRC